MILIADSGASTTDWRSLDQDGPVKFEEVLQGEFPCKADGTAFDVTFENFVFDQGFANLSDADMRIFHSPDLTALERLHGGVLFWVLLHGHQFSKTGIRKRGNSGSAKRQRPDRASTRVLTADTGRYERSTKVNEGRRRTANGRE